MAQKFIWLADDNYTRKGALLKKGAEHSAADFGEAVVAEWVKSGAAKYVSEAKKKTTGGGE